MRGAVVRQDVEGTTMATLDCSVRPGMFRYLNSNIQLGPKAVDSYSDTVDKVTSLLSPPKEQYCQGSLGGGAAGGREKLPMLPLQHLLPEAATSFCLMMELALPVLK